MARRGKGWALAMLVAVAPIALVTFRADAFPDGSAYVNCTSCHTAPASVSALTTVSILAPSTVIAGDIYPIYVYVTNAMYQRFGFSLHASAGTFYAPGPSSTTTVKGGDATHDCFTTSCGSAGCTNAAYAYWTAPSTSASVVTFEAYGLAHDGNATGCPGSPSGVGSTGDVMGVAAGRTSDIVCNGGGFGEDGSGPSHRCGLDCVADDDPAHCGTSCEPCAAPVGGTARCAGFPLGCVGQCPLDAHVCGGACVADSPAACGSACTECLAPAHATPTCIAGGCGWVCEAGLVACGGECITGTCAGFDGGVDAFDAGRDVSIDTAFPDEDTFPAPRIDAGPDAGPGDGDASACGCATPGAAPTNGGAICLVGLVGLAGALLRTRRRARYKRMSM